MGRPIKKKFFGNLNQGSSSGITDDGIGGEGVATVALGTAGSGYSQGVTLTTTAPQLPGGVQATFGVTVTTATGAVASYTVVEGGSGYTATPSVTLNVPSPVTKAGTTGTTATTIVYVTNTTGIFAGMVISGGMTAVGGRVVSIGAVSGGVYPIYSTGANTDNFTATSVTFTDAGASAVPGTVTMAALQQNAINGVAYIPGGSSAVVYDIIKQEASKRYLVKTAQGNGQCKLVAAAPGAGEMTIIATDTLGSTYYVTKLTARRAVLTRQTDGGSGYEFATGAVSGWSINAASTGVVSIANA